MKKRTLQLLAAPAALICLPYSFFEWWLTGRKAISAKLIDFAVGY